MNRRAGNVSSNCKRSRLRGNNHPDELSDTFLRNVYC
jgi:hypothetical protein